MVKKIKSNFVFAGPRVSTTEKVDPTDSHTKRQSRQADERLGLRVEVGGLNRNVKLT